MGKEPAVTVGIEKKARKSVGEGMRNIPGISHLIFKGQLDEP